MIWSRYNYLYESSKHGFFLYNSRTNAFIKVDNSTYEYLNMLKNKKENIKENEIEASLLALLSTSKILVNSYDDDNFVSQKKYIKYNSNFNNNCLGLVIVPTCSCNFICPYCYEHDLPNDIMDNETEVKLIEFIKSFKKTEELHICWHGGEPLLAFDSIKRILQMINNEDSINLTVHSMVSNGYLLDEEKCRFLKKHNLGSIQITIDGLEKTHNNSRIHKSGQPTYKRIINNIETIFKIMPDCHVIVRMNIHEENKHECPYLYHELKRKWEGHNFSISMKYTIDHGNCNVACIKDRGQLKYAKELYDKYNIKNISFYPKIQIGGCTADHNNSFIVGPKGELYKCWVDVGKLDREIGSIYQDEINLSIFSEYLVGTDMFNDPKCLSCFLFPVCDGGCPLFRLENKFTKKPYNVCPINEDEIIILLDTFYEQQMNNRNV